MFFGNFVVIVGVVVVLLAFSIWLILVRKVGREENKISNIWNQRRREGTEGREDRERQRK